MWQLRQPTRWFNSLLFYTGWLGLGCHSLLMLYCWWQQIPYQISWWFTAVAPAFSVLWGGVPALQIQRELPAHRKSSFLS